ncbi:hypothetical protein D3C72_1722060 [compost metagenome]
MPGQPGAGGVVAHARGFVGGQEQLADRGQVQRRTAADGAHHLHAGALAVGALDIHDLVALAYRQVDRLPGHAVQRAHRRQRRVAHRQARLDQVAQFQQAHAKAVAARIGAVDETAGHHVVKDAVRGGRMQARGQRQLFEADRVGVLGEGVQQGHHALDDLDGRLAG